MNVGTTIIKCRHSVREFKSDPVEDRIVRDALDCARLAPTANNLQPWLFGVIRDRALLSEIADRADHGKFIAGAALCFAVFGEKKAKYYLEDCCAATENLIIALQAYGVGSCWVAGEKKDYAEDIRKLLHSEGTSRKSAIRLFRADASSTPRRSAKSTANMYKSISGAV